MTAGLENYVEWKMGGDPLGTCLQGEIKCAYADLVAVFGEPNARGDEHKIDAEWVMTFTSFGFSREVATIYNYKTGRNYLGAEGRAVEDIADWHVGGANGSSVVGKVCSMLIAHLMRKREDRT
jgi:hypothetical protein